MDRAKLMQRIVEEYRRHGKKDQEAVLLDALKHMPDTGLYAFAIELNIDLSAPRDESKVFDSIFGVRP